MPSLFKYILLFLAELRFSCKAQSLMPTISSKPTIPFAINTPSRVPTISPMSGSLIPNGFHNRFALALNT